MVRAALRGICCVTMHAQLTPGLAARRGCLFYRVAARAARHRRCGRGLGPAACEGQLAARALVIAQRRAKPWNQALACAANSMPQLLRKSCWARARRASPCARTVRPSIKANADRPCWGLWPAWYCCGVCPLTPGSWQAVLGPAAASLGHGATRCSVGCRRGGLRLEASS